MAFLVRAAEMGLVPFTVAELKVYLATDPRTNVALLATCYSLPIGGVYYWADLGTAVLTRINDGLTSTYSHSSECADARYFALATGFCHFDMCVLSEPLPVGRIKVAPREGFADRSQLL